MAFFLSGLLSVMVVMPSAVVTMIVLKDFTLPVGVAATVGPSAATRDEMRSTYCCLASSLWDQRRSVYVSQVSVFAWHFLFTLIWLAAKWKLYKLTSNKTCVRIKMFYQVTCDTAPKDFQASHFALFTKSSIPGLGVLQGPCVDCSNTKKEKTGNNKTWQ